MFSHTRVGMATPGQDRTNHNIWGEGKREYSLHKSSNRFLELVKFQLVKLFRQEASG